MPKTYSFVKPKTCKIISKNPFKSNFSGSFKSPKLPNNQVINPLSKCFAILLAKFLIPSPIPLKRFFINCTGSSIRESITFSAKSPIKTLKIFLIGQRRILIIFLAKSPINFKALLIKLAFSAFNCSMRLSSSFKLDWYFLVKSSSSWFCLSVILCSSWSNLVCTSAAAWAPISCRSFGKVCT